MSAVQLPDLPTGSFVLDAMTGGGEPGDFWTLCGTSGSPVSVLALTIARANALLAGRSVVWLSSWQSPQALSDCMVSAEGHAAHDFLGCPRDEAERLRAEAARARLTKARLRLTQVERHDLLNAALGALADPPDLLVLDDLEADCQPLLDELRRLCADCGTWLVAVVPSTRQAVAGRRQPAPDAMVWVNEQDWEGPRCGEVELTFYRRGTPVGMEIVAHQPHLRRVIDVLVEPSYGSLAAPR